MNLSRHEFRKGVALVVTLLLLSVITFLAVAFLALSRRDRQSVAISIIQTESKYLAETAAARAQAEIFGFVAAKGNLGSAPLMVSRTYQNQAGFDPGVSSFDNVNWDRTITGGALSEPNRLQMLTNLFFDPRLPVFVQTNASLGAPRDFRFYLDFNRNGRFDTNGVIGNLDASGNTIGSYNAVGDPEWIGVLEKPQFGHSKTNRAVGRFAFVVLPATMSLDVNRMHNYSKGNYQGGGLPATMGSDGFLRNQGVGSFELNLAAFLKDLNTNVYLPLDYEYFNSVAVNNRGRAFDDANSILRYRYGRNANNQLSVRSILGANGVTNIQNDLVDGYAKAPVLAPPFSSGIDLDDATQPWPGSPSTNVFTDVQEFFNSSKSRAAFVQGLQGTNNSTYDRYTFYRLLSQMGVASEPETGGKINLNYLNDPAVNAVGQVLTNWSPIAFFTNVADRLIRDAVKGTNRFAGRLIPNGFSITNIPVYPTNHYTPALHRLLQLSANLYEATRPNPRPVVFRPLLFKEGNLVRISGYQVEYGTNILDQGRVQNRVFDLGTIATNSSVGQAGLNVDRVAYGIPMIIGARKGLPNLNEVALLSRVAIQRKLQVTKIQPGTLPVRTNQMLIFGITNQFAIEAWNPYTNAYQPTANKLKIIGNYQPVFSLTNSLGIVRGADSLFLGANTLPQRFAVNLDSGWAGTRFVLPLIAETLRISNSVYYVTNNQFLPAQGYTNLWASGLATPDMHLNVAYRLQFAIVDATAVDPTTGQPGVILDYVSLDGLGFSTNILAMLNDQALGSPGNNSPSFWATNGIQSQMDISLGNVSQLPPQYQWNDALGIVSQRQKEIDAFRVFCGLRPISGLATNPAVAPSIAWKAPFDVVDSLNMVSVYSANDPLVHYTTADLTEPTIANPIRLARTLPGSPSITVTNSGSSLVTMGKLNVRYRPWGNKRFPGTTKALQDTVSSDPDFVANVLYKDPLIRQADDWDFPTNKLAGVGQIGRVHRGTPWQTIYLKSWPDPKDKWLTWAGYAESHPTNDWKLVDTFTTTFSDAANTGLLSVNQPDIASWSALLSGVVVISNNLPAIDEFGPAPRFEAYTIEPSSSGLQSIVTNLHFFRTNQAPSGMFTKVGDILRVPQMTLESPFLNKAPGQIASGISDAAYEWIPRQTLSLLTIGKPRYMIYAYGQALKPAERSIVFNTGYENMVTNYQVMGEYVTRSLIRLEGSITNPVVVLEKFDVLPSE